MKGICHIWSRGRHFSPSLPGDRYLNLGSKSDLRAEISGSIVWYDALAPRPEVLLSFSAFYANNVLWVLSAQELVSSTDFLNWFPSHFHQVALLLPFSKLLSVLWKNCTYMVCSGTLCVPIHQVSISMRSCL